MVAVLLEAVLFRMFARTGIYLFNEDSPGWLYQAYASAVWFGNTMFNFATILSLMLLALSAAYLWLRRDSLGRTLPWLLAVMVIWNLALLGAGSGTLLALGYLATSAAVVAGCVASAWPKAGLFERVTLALLAASFAGVYYFETIAPLRNAGLIFADRGLVIFQVSEALAGAAIIAAFVAWGRTRSIRLLAFPVLAGLVMAGSYFSRPDSFPLIATWSLGVTMSMPFVFYVFGLILLGVTLLKLMASGRPTLAYGLTLIYFSHRMLPLTYFNVLVLVGFALIVVAFAEKRHARDEVTDGNFESRADGKRIEAF